MLGNFDAFSSFLSKLRFSKIYYSVLSSVRQTVYLDADQTRHYARSYLGHRTVCEGDNQTAKVVRSGEKS